MTSNHPFKCECEKPNPKQSVCQNCGKLWLPNPIHPTAEPKKCALGGKGFYASSSPTAEPKCTCITHNNGGEDVVIVNDCPVHDELCGRNAKLVPSPVVEGEYKPLVEGATPISFKALKDDFAKCSVVGGAVEYCTCDSPDFGDEIGVCLKCKKMPAPPQEHLVEGEWEERFDREFRGDIIVGEDKTHSGFESRGLIKSFITNLLHSEREKRDSEWKPTLEWWRNHGLTQCNYDECYCQNAYELVLIKDTRAEERERIVKMCEEMIDEKL